MRANIAVGLIILFGIAAATIEVTRVFKILDQLPLLILIEVSLFALILIGVAVRKIFKHVKRDQNPNMIERTEIEN